MNHALLPLSAFYQKIRTAMFNDLFSTRVTVWQASGLWWKGAELVALGIGHDRPPEGAIRFRADFPQGAGAELEQMFHTRAILQVDVNVHAILYHLGLWHFIEPDTHPSIGWDKRDRIVL
jgi:hypothetical protein